MLNIDLYRETIKERTDQKGMGALYVAEGICDKEINGWKYYKPVFISAPTGAGKNWFVKNTLRKKAKEKGKTIVLFSNRSALSIQQKREFNNGPYNPSDDVLENMWKFGNVAIFSYQQIWSWMNNGQWDQCCQHWSSWKWNMADIEDKTTQYYMTGQGIQNKRQALIEEKRYLENISECSKVVGYLYCAEYIVFDEAHFFLSDSRFNNTTYHLLHKLLPNILGSIRIYMSATIEEVKDAIGAVEWEAHVEKRKFSRANLGDAKICELIINEYKFEPRNRDRYTYAFFNTWEDIVYKIRATAAREKWLIFVKSIEEGKEIESLLKRVCADREIAVINSKKKSELVFRDICHYESFLQQILISTIVMDNGVNIKDPDLKHIVVHSYDRVSSVQMVGRKRFVDDNDDTVNVYFKLPENGSRLNNEATSTKDLREFLEKAGNNPTFRLVDSWGSLDQSKQSLFLPLWMGNGIVYEMNEFAREKLRIDEGCYSELCDDFRRYGKDKVAQTMLGWHDKKLQYEENEYMIKQSKEEGRAIVIDYIESLIKKNHRTTEETREKDFNELKNICKAAGIQLRGKYTSSEKNIKDMLKDNVLPFIYERTVSQENREWWFEYKDTSEDTEADGNNI